MNKSSLFELLLKSAMTGVRQKIPHRKFEGPVPLSFSQRRMWILNQLAPESPAYNVVRAFRLQGDVHPHILEKCFNDMIRRHEILRTSFSTEHGQPVQIIQPGVPFHVSVIDLRNISADAQETHVRQILSEESQQLFDLTQAPLWRVTLLQLQEEEYVLLFVPHHIITDGWSLSLFFRELAALYEAFLKGTPSLLSKLPIQYADFVIWQREWLQRESSDLQLKYWKQQLGGDLPVLELPTDYPRPKIQTFRGARQSFVLPPKIAKRLKSLNVKEDVTLFMTLLTAFNILLYRYTGQKDLLVGSPIANRRQSDVEVLIGVFINMLVLRTEISDNPTFRELLGQVRQTCLEAYIHQEFPFEKVVEELKPEYDQSHSPLFQVMFALQNFPPFPLKFDTVTLTPLDVDNETAKFDLSLNMIERKDALHGSFEYNTDMFDTATIERMVGHFHILLEGILADPDQRIAQLPLLTEAEKQQILVEWNDTHADYPGDKCVHQLFEDQVERAPDAIALVFEEQQLAYRELNTRANQLAHALLKRGVGPETLVGICLERGIDMVVAILAILKAGGAYVPLDPAYPQDRVAFMLHDAQIPGVITQTHIQARLPQHDLFKIHIDQEWSSIACESAGNPESAVTAKNLAYMMYTSGSTGTPKGVQITHQNVVNLSHFWRSRLTDDELEGVLFWTTICFDGSTFELFVPLAWGKKIIVVDTILHLPESAARHQVTFINSVPSAMAELVRINGLPPRLQAVTLGGESLPRILAQELHEKGIQRVFNVYGPTEDTVHSTTCLIERNATFDPPIGRPADNKQVYILDRYLQPVPTGVVGELYISGAGLARGYWRRPELTTAKFITYSWGPITNRRLYRTGDLVRYRHDGNIEFLGRADHQVKLRGFRIELGEIETVLRQHPAVREAVVLVREDVPNDKRLVAYVASEQHSTSPQDLREFLQQKLPDYMIPVVFVFLDTLPLTPNGKVDRNALPVPDQASMGQETAFTPPRTQFEERLLEIWQKVLNLPRIGIYDNFFALGGHSLLAMQLIARIDRELDVELSLREILEMPTIAELAIGIVQRKIESLDDDELAEVLAQLGAEPK